MRHKYSEYWNAGYAVIPERESIPMKGVEWSRIYKDGWVPNVKEIAAWDRYTTAGYGLVCGKPSGVIAIDFDIDDEKKIDSCIRMLGDTPVKKKGTKGLTAFYRYNGERNQNFCKNSEVLVEIMSSGRKTTIPPSALPKSKGVKGNYEWIGEELLNVDSLPSLPSNYEKIICGNLGITLQKADAGSFKRVTTEYEKTDLAEVTEAIDYIREDDYHTWISIGMALCSEFGDAGFQVWDNWSSHSPKYNRREMWTKWKSFHATHSVGIGTLFHFAIQGGYEKALVDRSVEISPLEFESYKRGILKKRSEKINKVAPEPDFYRNAGGLVGEITRWTVESSLYPQPMLALGAAITVVGFLMGKDFVTKEKMPVKPSLYTIGISNTSTGKEIIKNRSIKLLRALDEDLMKRFEAAVSSGSALQESLVDNEGWVYLIWEECSFLFKEMMGKNSSAHARDIARIMLDVYTSSFFKSRRMAKSNENWKPQIIDNPAVSLFGLTQKAPFFESITEHTILSGQLNRMLFVQGTEVRPLSVVDDMFDDHEEEDRVPEGIEGACREILERVKGYHGIKPGPIKVPYSNEAKAYARTMQKEFDVTFQKSQINDERYHNLCGRYVELVKKIALIYSSGIQIERGHLEWARAVVDYSNGVLIQAADEMIHTNDFSKYCREVRMYIEKKGGVTRTELSQRFKGVKPRELDEIINKLENADEIVIKRVAGEGRKGRTMYEIKEAA